MKLSDLSDQEWYQRLNARRMRQAKAAKAWWQYIDLEQPLYYVARILREQSDRFPPLLIAWPELVVDAVEERLDVEGFRLGGQDALSDELKAVWQDNNLDEESGEAHYEALVTGGAYLMTGPGDGRYPLITVEYGDQVAVEIDPRTRKVIAALKVWKDDQDSTLESQGVLYLPGGRYVEFDGADPVNDSTEPAFSTGDETDHGIPVEPMLNRPRRGIGRSELVALKPIVDGANQFATNLMAAGEHHAVQRKWAVGASEEDFVDEDGNKVPMWKVAMGDVWAIPHRPLDNGEVAQEIKVGQFAASDLRNFHESFKMLATVAASLYGLPPNYMGYSSDNPVSAEAIRYSLDRLVKRAERRQRTFGGAHEKAMRRAMALMEMDPSTAAALETVWRDPSTPTRAAMMDAAQKGVASGIIDNEIAWDMIGLTEQQKRGMRSRLNRTGGFALPTIDSLRGLDVGVNGAATSQGP